MKYFRRMWLFLRIVYRQWDEIDGKAWRLSPKVAWDVSKIVWKY